MQTFDLSNIKISDESIFEYFSHPQMYTRTSVLSEEIFIRYILSKALLKVSVFANKWLLKEDIFHTEERTRCFSELASLSDFVESQTTMGIFRDGDFGDKGEIDEVCKMFNWVTKSVLNEISIHEEVKQEEFLLDSELIKKQCSQKAAELLESIPLPVEEVNEELPNTQEQEQVSLTDEQKEYFKNFNYFSFKKDIESLNNRKNNLRKLFLDRISKNVCTRTELEILDQSLIVFVRDLARIFESRKMTKNDIQVLSNQLSEIDKNNRLIFSEREEKGEFFEDTLTEEELELEHQSFDDQIFDDDGNIIVGGMERVLRGLKRIIEEKYLCDLQFLKNFVDTHGSDDKVCILVMEIQKAQEIARRCYSLDEELEKNFIWFEENEPKLLEASEIYIARREVPEWVGK